MIDERDVFEKSFRRYEPEGGSFDRLVRRRDRKRRNQRIAAGVVGIAVFVAAVWIVTSVGAFDRTQTPAAPGPTETGSTQTGPPSATASGTPHEVRNRMCDDGARWWMELTDMGDRIKVRFEVHQSPVGHEWLIRFRHPMTICCAILGPVFFQATRVASDSGVFVVQLRYPDWERFGGVHAKARDTQTGEVCIARVLYDGV